MPTDYGIRQGLLSKGYSNDDISFDPNSGYVQVKGQNFLKPEMNVQGTTFTSQDNFNNAYNQFNKQQQPQQTTQPVQPVTTQQPPANPYNDQYTKLISDIMTRMNQPQQDVYSTPQYAAAQAQQQRAAQQGIRSAQEALGSSGFGRSTTLGESANRVQNDANEYLTTQLVPQIQQQLAAQRQAEINNQMSLLSPIFNQVSRQDNLTQQSKDNNRADAALTGYFDPNPEQTAAVKQRMSANSAAYASASPEEQMRLHEENIQLAKSIGGTDTTGSGDYEFTPQRTVQGQTLDNQVSETAYNHARDSLLDKRYEEKFIQDIKQQGFENALKIAVQEHQISNDNAQIAISARNAATSETSAANSNQNAKDRLAFDKEQASSKPAPKNDLESQYISGFENLTPDKRVEALKTEKATIVADLGISGYNTLYNMYIDQYGDPK